MRQPVHIVICLCLEAAAACAAMMLLMVATATHPTEYAENVRLAARGGCFAFGIALIAMRLSGDLCAWLARITGGSRLVITLAGSSVPALLLLFGAAYLLGKPFAGVLIIIAAPLGTAVFLLCWRAVRSGSVRMPLGILLMYGVPLLYCSSFPVINLRL